MTLSGYVLIRTRAIYLWPPFVKEYQAFVQPPVLFFSPQQETRMVLFSETLRLKLLKGKPKKHQSDPDQSEAR